MMDAVSPFQEQSDQQLATKSSQGSERAFEAFYHRRFQPLYDFALRIVRDSDAAADVVQATFVKTWERLNQGKIPENINAWMYTLARNAAIDELRRRKRAPATDFSSDEIDSPKAYTKFGPGISPNPQRALEDKELVDMVWRAASMLRPEEYSLLDLYLRQGLKPDELAEGLGLRRGTVYTRISRLKDSLEESIVVDFLARRGRRDCTELDQLVSAYENAGATDRLRYHVSKHLESCPRCQETKRRILSPSEIFAGLALIPAPVALKNNIWARISTEIGRGLIRWGKLRTAMKFATTKNAVIAGTGVILIAIAGLTLQDTTLRDTPGALPSIKVPAATLEVAQASGSVKSPESTELIPTDSSPIPTSATAPVAEQPELPAVSPTTTETSTATTTPSPTPTYTPSATMTPTASPTPSLTPTVTSSFTPTATAVVWLNDPFDGLSTGPLNGQHGWSAFQASARVINYTGKGKVVRIDPNAGATIGVSKNFSNQSGGIVWFEFDVMVIDGTVSSMAKFEMTTNPNAGWDKKFQIYFGTTMRVNYNGSGGATVLVNPTVMDHWYRIRCRLNLNNDRLKVWVDGNLVADNIPMHSGALTQIAIWGWDRDGYVLVDNLLGTK